jgi:hypothetical protein
VPSFLLLTHAFLPPPHFLTTLPHTHTPPALAPRLPPRSDHAKALKFYTAAREAFAAAAAAAASSDGPSTAAAGLAWPCLLSPLPAARPDDAPGPAKAREEPAEGLVEAAAQVRPAVFAPSRGAAVT